MQKIELQSPIAVANFIIEKRSDKDKSKSTMGIV